MTRCRPRRGGGVLGDGAVESGETDNLHSTEAAAADKTSHAWRYRLPGHQGQRILVRPIPASAYEIAAELRQRFGEEPAHLEPIEAGDDRRSR